MTFYQNPFSFDYQGNLLLGDRHHIPGFPIKRNAGRGDDLVMAWQSGPFDLSGNDADGVNSRDTLVIWFARNTDEFTNWAKISIALPNGAAETNTTIAAALNANAQFSAWFTLSSSPGNDTSEQERLFIRQKKNVGEFRFYIENGRAEEAIQFNARSGVNEILTYFDRDRVFHFFTSDERTRHNPAGDRPGNNCLIKLDPAGSNVDAAVIDNALNAAGKSLGFNSSVVQEDWEIMSGKSGIFQFTKYSAAVVASTNTSIIYPAGAEVGDFALKVVEQYDVTPELVNKFNLPYTLEAGDLITPP
jgi:hypothetical protein